MNRAERPRSYWLGRAHAMAKEVHLDDLARRDFAGWILGFPDPVSWTTLTTSDLKRLVDAFEGHHALMVIWQQEGRLRPSTRHAQEAKEASEQ